MGPEHDQTDVNALKEVSYPFWAQGFNVSCGFACWTICDSHKMSFEQWLRLFFCCLFLIVLIFLLLLFFPVLFVRFNTIRPDCWNIHQLHHFLNKNYVLHIFFANFVSFISLVEDIFTFLLLLISQLVCYRKVFLQLFCVFQTLLLLDIPAPPFPNRPCSICCTASVPFIYPFHPAFLLFLLSPFEGKLFLLGPQHPSSF
jgi:hypothetical protein